uniref:RNA polymerase sigma factor n=1 Tax=uncultured Draconibacterium sp. TaxID=1573823 RepID=UPI0032170DF5
MLTDQELWENFLRGNAESFKMIYERTASDLFTYGRRFSTCDDLVKDCIQDLFVSLYSTRSRLGKTNKIMPYLMVSLKRSILKRIQNDKSNKLLSVDELPFIFELAEDDNTFIDEEDSDGLQLALNCLTPRQREAVYLKYVLDFSYEELSKVLNMSYQASRNLIYRSILKLRENLKSQTLVLFLLLRKSVG